MCKVSVIMPVYNGQEYLRESIDSVIRQTLQDWELLCVDDGSVDDSLAILRQYQMDDARVRIFTQSNQGAGSARNQGIKEARGKYLAFLDADDFYSDADALEKMVALCEEKKVPICGSFGKVLMNGVERVHDMFRELEKDFNTAQVYQYIDHQFDYGYYYFIFEREMLEDNNILFPRYRRFQDPVFFVKAMWSSREFVMVDAHLYCMRENDAVPKFNEKATEDLVNALIDNLCFAKEYGLDKLFETTRIRLEYEFAGIIYHNMSRAGTNILQLLLKANQVIGEKYGDEDYIIRPLKRILNCVAEDKDYYKERLLEKLKEQEAVAIYGAGKYAKAFVNFLADNDLAGKIKYILVARNEGNPQELAGIPVIEVKCFTEKEIPILVALGAHFHREVEETFVKNEIENFIFLDDMFLRELS